LTDAGRDVQKQVESVFATLELEAFGNLSVEERDLLRRLLLQVRENFLTVTGEEPWKL
jgi:DNA-binding MarR family transcriptional regulator